MQIYYPRALLKLSQRQVLLGSSFHILASQPMANTGRILICTCTAPEPYFGISPVINLLCYCDHICPLQVSGALSS